ncbi:hypothetical protein DdX_22137 [Ditylenchus destructor]|uniref:Uncharacterized protein n=1 Tax=Ditylenchus destructor TaxID=166010 RepID=A0AAD4MES7_9BILA|nr:hypothetical protein DdX_22137 [Ditylenchus destructor]
MTNWVTWCRRTANWAKCCVHSARAWCSAKLLLDTMVQNTPVAMLLIAAGGDGISRVVFSNLAARKLLHSGWKLEGQRMEDVLEQLPVELRDAIGRGGDSLFAVKSEKRRGRGRRRGRRTGLSPVAARVPAQRPPARSVAGAPAHRRTAPAGSTDLEEGDPGDQPRTQQLAGADRLAGALRWRVGQARTLRPAAGDLHHHRRPGPPPRRLHPRLRAFRQAAAAAAADRALGAVPVQPVPADSVHDGACTRRGTEQPDRHRPVRPGPAQPAEECTRSLRRSRSAQRRRADAADPAAAVAAARRAGPGQGHERASAAECADAVLFDQAQRHRAGLALTREIVEAHGGRVSLQNRTEGGLCVSILLPVG